MSERQKSVSNERARRFSRRAGLTHRLKPMLQAVGVCLLLGFPADAPAAERALAVERKSLERGRASQEQVTAMSEEAAQLLARYRTVTDRTASQALYNDNLEKITRSQVEEIASLQRQLGSIEETRREIVPFKLRMLDALAGFIERDLPFLAAERRGRSEGLAALMERADVTVAEKFRRLMDAYQQEIDYGRTIETYAGELNDGNGVRNVEFLRIGRLAYLYQTPDRRESGFWHPGERQWQTLERSYRQPVRRGIQVANRQVAPELIRIPVVVSSPRLEEPAAASDRAILGGAGEAGL